MSTGIAWKRSIAVMTLKTVDVWRLDFNDGSWRLVTAPPILRDGVMVSRMVRAYHRELLQGLQGKYIWPVTADEERRLFAEFSAYYRHLARLVIPDIDPSDLAGPSRHQFFIATESHPHPGKPDEMVRGLSGLEQLLGYSYPEQEVNPDEQDEGAGDSDLSTLAIAFLTFQRQDVLGMAHCMSSTDLSGVVGFANRKLSEAHDQANSDKKGDGAAEKWEDPGAGDDDKFKQNKPLILERLQGLAISVPNGF